MKVSRLLTSNGLDLPCVVLPTRRTLFGGGTEVMVYCQNRLVKGIIQEEDDPVAEIEIFVDWCIIPELQEMLCDLE